jgi:hypothetical protein
MAEANDNSPDQLIPSSGHLSLSTIRLPDEFELLVGADTGTYMSACLIAVQPDTHDTFVIFEAPNYHYVGGEIELLGMSTPEWADLVVSTYRHFRPNTSKIHGWVDPNSQFRMELQHYDLVLHPNHRGLELRVEICREYFQAKKIWLAPWLEVLPYELEIARWPDESTTTGKFVREKRNDHTLDGVEHVLSRRPRGRLLRKEKSLSFKEKLLQKYRQPGVGYSDPHLGRL